MSAKFCKREGTVMREKYGNYIRWGVTVFCIMAASILFFFLLFRLDTITRYIGKILSVLTPILLGAVIAYLLNPIVSFLDKYLSRFLGFLHVPSRVRRFLSKATSILVSLGLLITFVSVLLSMIIPELYASIVKLAGDSRTYMTNIYNFVTRHLENHPEILAYAQDILNKVSAAVMDWINNDLLIQAQTLMSGLTVGIIGAAKVIVNIVLGLIVSVYLLSSKERFVGQSKKLLYTLIQPERANILLYIFRQVDHIFGGFISGKLLDSLIIGIICFIGMNLLHMPYPILISTIVGVTNVIPFFGPYFGAVPSAFLILIVSPKQCLIFIIFILVLQQFDGNILGPKILGDSTGLTPFWVVLAITIGGGLFGFPGMLLGVPTFAVLYFLAKTFCEYRLQRKHLPTASLAYCRIEQIDPETGKIIFFKRAGTEKKKNKEPNRQDLINAIDVASTRSRKKHQESEKKE